MSYVEEFCYQCWQQYPSDPSRYTHQACSDGKSRYSHSQCPTMPEPKSWQQQYKEEYEAKLQDGPNTREGYIRYITKHAGQLKVLHVGLPIYWESMSTDVVDELYQQARTLIERDNAATERFPFPGVGKINRDDYEVQ